MKTKHLQLDVTGFKALSDNSMRFTCYGNTKGNIDHALDMTMNGAYSKSIAKHKANGTMPKMLWGHNSSLPPVGVWLDMKEDSKGLFMEGEFADTPRGIELYKLAKMKAINSFSIGYNILDEKLNSSGRYNELHELHIMETSIVNFACNELSTLQTIKSRMDETGVISKADLREVLQSSGLDLSKREIERITSYYNPDVKSEIILPNDFIKTLDGLELFN